MASFIAAGSAYATHGINTIPFFIYYSMFGFQRIADFIWAAADMRTRGFLLGGTAGRTTLAGEGLQHQDGNSHVLALPVPNLRAYDPAFAYEIAVIIQDGIRRMYKDGESIFYYITVMNEPYAMPPMPAGVEGRHSEGHVPIPRCRKQKIETARATLRQRRHPERSAARAGNPRAEIRRRRRCLERHQLQGALQRRHRNRTLEPPASRRKSRAFRTSRSASTDAPGVLVAASDYLKTLPNMISKWMPRRLASLGTDGFGRSEGRASLRDFFEVDSRFITLATLHELFTDGKIEQVRPRQSHHRTRHQPGQTQPRNLLSKLGNALVAHPFSGEALLEAFLEAFPETFLRILGAPHAVFACGFFAVDRTSGLSACGLISRRSYFLNVALAFMPAKMS